MKKTKIFPEPFIKWVGGKRNLLPAIHESMPEKFTKYFEPFVGGGAVLWSMAEKFPLLNIVISDSNEELVNLYETVRDYPEKLIEESKKHINDEEYYYKIRSLDRNNDFSSLNPITRASRFLYLNKTGYNGLWRVNSKGRHNVPFGFYKNPKIVDEQNIFACSEFLKKTTILQGDFSIILPMVDEDSFVYMDPPYHPISATASFTNYSRKGFDSERQIELKKFCDALNAKGAKFMTSNSFTPFIEELYSGYKLKVVSADRFISCKKDGRKKTNEYIIVNY